MLDFLRLLFAKLQSTRGSSRPSEGALFSERTVVTVELKDGQAEDPTESHHETQEPWVAFDENLLEKARTQWQFGDWQTLSTINREQLQHHPERDKLAILVAAAHGQSGNLAMMRSFCELARDWGCSRRLIARVMISGVDNSLGNAWFIAGQSDKAELMYERSISTGSPGSDHRLLKEARTRYQKTLFKALRSNDAVAVGSAIEPMFALDEKSELSNANSTVESTQSSPQLVKPANPYAHNRDLTDSIVSDLLSFGKNQLGLTDLKKTYVQYLGLNALQTERSSVGRLATTVQDAVVRQLVVDCLSQGYFRGLEIGCLYGIGLILLYNQAATRFDSAKIIGLDPFDGYYGQALDALLNQPVNHNTFRRNMQIASIPDNDCELIKLYSTNPDSIAKMKDLGKVNLLVIDGDHSYEGVKFDFENYFQFVEAGGYVIFDDYNAKEWPGVQKFIDEDLVTSYPDLEYLGFYSRTAVARRRLAVETPEATIAN